MIIFILFAKGEIYEIIEQKNINVQELQNKINGSMSASFLCCRLSTLPAPPVQTPAG